VNGLTVGRGIGTVNSENTIFGVGTLAANTSGASNTALGYNTLNLNGGGSNNTAVGRAAQFNNSGGNNNTAMGNAALYDNISGSANTAVGKSALQYNKGSNNIAIGAYADVNDVNISNATAIGHGARVRFSNTIQLGADGTTLNGGLLPTTAITNVRTSGTLTLLDVTYPNTHAALSGQVLTSLGSGTLTWTTASGAALTLTTTGTGAATLSGTTLNIPSTTNYTLPTASASVSGGVKVGTNLSIDGSGVLSAVVRLNSDEFTATAAQTTFTFTTASSNTNAVQTPLSKPYMYINGTRIKNSAYTWTSGTTVTYVPANNSSYALVAGDRVQFDYAY
jgi:hypothetical protein